MILRITVQLIVILLVLTQIVHCKCWIEEKLPYNRCLIVSCGPSSKDEINDKSLIHGIEQYDCVGENCQEWNPREEVSLDALVFNTNTTKTVHLCPRIAKTTTTTTTTTTIPVPTISPTINVSFFPTSPNGIPSYMPAVAAMLFFCGVLLVMALVMCSMVICMGVKHLVYGSVVGISSTQPNPPHLNYGYENIPDVIFCVDMEEDYSTNTEDAENSSGWDL